MVYCIKKKVGVEMTGMQKRLLKIGGWSYAIVAAICWNGGLMMEWLFLTGFGAACTGLFLWLRAILHKKERKKANGILFLGIVLLAFAGRYV